MTGRAPRATLAHLAAAVAVTAIVIGCDGGGSCLENHAEPTLVTTSDAWRPVAAGQDPFSGHRPEEVVCPSFGYGVERGFFEINTGECNYATFTQEAQQPVGCGQELAFVFWHLALWGPDGESAHVALMVADELVWQTHTALPAMQNAIEIRASPSRPIEPGEAIFFHVHNHGSNSYRIGALTAQL